jgi:hypothetical protein
MQDGGSVTDRDPRIDPQPGDCVDMAPHIKPKKWTRHVMKVEAGHVAYWGYFFGTYLNPMLDTLDEWREATKLREQAGSKVRI